MPEFSLPHDHGAHGHTEDLYRELKNVEHFGNRPRNRRKLC